MPANTFASEDVGTQFICNLLFKTDAPLEVSHTLCN
jgi:hypothetical protein